jgi:hypothetical protein
MIGTLEDVRRDVEHGVYDNTDHGICTGCGECCTNLLPMTDSEIVTIRRYIIKHGIRQRVRKMNFLSDPVMDMTCPFLDDSKKKDKCTIYPVRPQVCRSFNCRKYAEGILPNVTRSLLEAKPRDVRHTFYG